MRHGMANRKLGRKSAHRNAMFRNQLASMIDHERIITTLIKAKELRPQIEKMVTLGKEDSIHGRRLAARIVPDETLIQKLFTNISPRFVERPGGYTRIIKLGPRRGDGAEMAILEFVDFKFEDEKKAAAAPAAKKSKAKKPADEAEDETAEAKPKKTAPKKAASKKAAPKKSEAEKPKEKKAAKKKSEK
jgi:large subunit ribosomal protein L17